MNTPSTAADFETSLFGSVNAGDTTATLTSIEDGDGIDLADGIYSFTIDNNSDHKEYIVATLTDTALSSVMSVSRQGVVTTGFSKFHRNGAVVEITDWTVLSSVANVLNGVTPLDAGIPLAYGAAPALSSPNQLATVQYVLDHVNGGPVSFNAVTFSAIAGESISSGQWVYLNISDGRWYLTDATNLTKSYGVKIGKALGAGTTGNAISSGVFISGLETAGTYSAHTTYYLSNTPGSLATSAGTYSVVVGITDANSRLIVNKIEQSTLDAAGGSLGTPSGTNRFLTQENEYSGATDQSQITQNASTIVGAANSAASRNKVAQSFIPTRIKIGGVNLYKIADSGTFTGTVTVAIQADSAGSPSGSNLASVTILNAEWLLLSAGAFQIAFANDLSLTIGSTYWIVISTSTADNTNHPNLGTSSMSLYANGILKYNNTADGWVVTSTDLYFQTLNGFQSQVAETDSSTGMIPVAVSPMGLLDLDITSTTVSNTTVETTVYTKYIPPNVLKSIGGLHVRAFATQFTTNSQNQQLKLKLNGSTIATVRYDASASPSVSGTYDFYVINTGSLSAQKYIATCMLGVMDQNTSGSDTNSSGTGALVNTGTTSVDLSGGAVLTLTQTMTGTSGTSYIHKATIVTKISL